MDMIDYSEVGPHCVLGSGHFGIVRVASLLSNPSKKYAVKSVQKDKMKEDLHMLRRELEILKNLDHPNIVKFYETYQDQKYIHFVQEYCSGGELLERVVKDGMISENQASIIMQSILQAVNYLHEMGICHRDLKLENFLFSSSQPDAQIKIIDFGLSKHWSQVDRNDKMGYNLQTVVGTPIYVAPEVLKGSYDYRCDYWSLGIIIYILLSGQPPFIGENKGQIFDAILHKKIGFDGPQWKLISKDAIDLIKKFLHKDRDKRLTAHNALKHNWFKNNHKINEEKYKVEVDKIQPYVLENLKKFREVTKFKKEVLKITLNFLSNQQLMEIQNAFKVIDKDNSGFISDSDLISLLNKLGYKQVEKEVNQLFDNLGIKNKMINYSQFLAATLDSKFFMDRENLWNIFKYFDVDNTNYIDIGNLKEILARNGRAISDNDIQQMIQEYDITKDGKISFEEFQMMMNVGEGLEKQNSGNKGQQINNDKDSDTASMQK